MQNRYLTSWGFIRSAGKACVLERLTRFTFYLGIGIALTLFVTFLYATLPFTIENSSERWNRLLRSDESVKAQLYQHSAYIAFLERYPDAAEHLWIDNTPSLELQEYNRESGNILYLEISLFPRGNMPATARCDYSDPDLEMQRFENLQAAKFIAETDCLD